MKRLPEIIQIAVFIAALCLLLLSCKTTKYVERETVRVDSSWIEQNAGLQSAITEIIESYEKEKETWIKTGILFDTVYRDTGRIINKVTFDNGRIKTAEGRIIAINTDLHEKTAELLDAHSTIDELSMKLEKTEAQLSKKQEVLIKEVRKSFLPWWVWLLILAGFLIRHYWPIIRTFVKLKFH